LLEHFVVSGVESCLGSLVAGLGAGFSVVSTLAVAVSSLAGASVVQATLAGRSIRIVVVALGSLGSRLGA